MARKSPCQACYFGASLMETFDALKRKKDLTTTEAERTVCATVVTRRVQSVREISRSKSTWQYFVTFQLESGELLELLAPEEAFPLLKDGIKATITHQNQKLLSYTFA